jgi:ABC-type branched-subunit amino acid transport system ATPase component
LPGDRIGVIRVGIVVDHHLFVTLKRLKEAFTILLIEQNVHLVSSVSDLGYVISDALFRLDG